MTVTCRECGEDSAVKRHDNRADDGDTRIRIYECTNCGTMSVEVKS